MYPLRFQPLYRHYLWGGRRLETVLGKALGPGDDFAESWEVVDHQDGQSVVAFGALAGKSLHELVVDHGLQLLGRHHPRKRFPLLFKFLDADRQLSVQVHPDDARAAKLEPPDFGKTEAWVILNAVPGSVLYAGLKRGFDRQALEREVNRQTTELCLHTIHPQPGDCIFLPAGTVHALGAGLVVAEIQQASNVTYRLYDWNRVDKKGNPRQLHVAAGLEAINYELGPVQPQVPQPSKQEPWEQLVACDKFILNRCILDVGQKTTMTNENEAHILAVIDGALDVTGDGSRQLLAKGQTTLIPAACGDVVVHNRETEPTVFLEMHLP